MSDCTAQSELVRTGPRDRAAFGRQPVCKLTGGPGRKPGISLSSSVRAAIGSHPVRDHSRSEDSTSWPDRCRQHIVGQSWRPCFISGTSSQGSTQVVIICSFHRAQRAPRASFSYSVQASTPLSIEANIPFFSFTRPLARHYRPEPRPYCPYTRCSIVVSHVS